MQKRLNEINADLEQIATRSAEIHTAVETAEHDELEKLSAEMTEMETRMADLLKEKAELEAIEEEARSFDETKATEIELERKEPTMEEVRNSKEYINAYAEYIRTGDDKECRALTSELVSGTVPVPTLVYDIVKTAWDREGIMSLVKKSYLKGDLKVGFEISSSDATNHTEGAAAVSEETLTLGIVELKPLSIKKWISISDEIYDLRGEEFLRYIYDELAYRIAKKAADNLIAAIEACGTQSTTTQVGVPAVTAATIGLGTIASALAQLSDEAANPVIMMNKLTWGAFKAVQAAGNFGYDPFEGLPVVFNNTIKAFSAASTGDTYVIVGDLANGALANYPNGDEIRFKFDEMSEKKKDMIEVLGRQYVAVAPVAPNHFAKVKK